MCFRERRVFQLCWGQGWLQAGSDGWVARFRACPTYSEYMGVVVVVFHLCVRKAWLWPHFVSFSSHLHAMHP